MVGITGLTPVTIAFLNGAHCVYSVNNSPLLTISQRIRPEKGDKKSDTEKIDKQRQSKHKHWEHADSKRGGEKELVRE